MYWCIWNEFIISHPNIMWSIRNPNLKSFPDYHFETWNNKNCHTILNCLDKLQRKMYAILINNWNIVRKKKNVLILSVKSVCLFHTNPNNIITSLLYIFFHLKIFHLSVAFRISVNKYFSDLKFILELFEE